MPYSSYEIETKEELINYVKLIETVSEDLKCDFKKDCNLIYYLHIIEKKTNELISKVIEDFSENQVYNLDSERRNKKLEEEKERKRLEEEAKKKANNKSKSKK